MASRIYELGEWEGDTFVFFEPFTFPGGGIAKRIDVSEIITDPSVPITKDALIEAMTDPNAMTYPWDDEGTMCLETDG